MFLTKKTSFLYSVHTKPRIFQAIQEIQHRLVWHRHILETLAIFLSAACALLRIVHLLVEVGIGGMHLQLTITAVIINIGHKHIVLEEVCDIAQTMVKHHETIHILIHDMFA